MHTYFYLSMYLYFYLSIYLSIICICFYLWASLIAQLVKNLPAMQETLVRFLGQEDLLEKELTTHSSIFGLPWWLSW